jgi:hypothetical protein
MGFFHFQFLIVEISLLTNIKDGKCDIPTLYVMPNEMNGNTSDWVNLKPLAHDFWLFFLFLGNNVPWLFNSIAKSL